MTPQTFEVSDEQKAEYVAQKATENHDMATVLDILRTGDHMSGAEPVSDDVCDQLSEVGSRDDFTRLAREHDEVYESFRRILMQGIQRVIGEASGRIPPAGSYANVVKNEMANHPDWFAAEILEQEKDIGGGSTYDSPEDYEMDLVLEQIAARRLDADNQQERKELWDSILKYSEYEVTVHIDTPEGKRNTTRTVLRESSTDAHNDVLEQVRRSLNDDEAVATGIGRTVETTVVSRYLPDFDPLDDLHEFVFYY